MTAESIAELLHARRIGPNRWQARCPVHLDKHPSLTIRQGHSGVLLRCWSARCSTEQIVTALGLSMADLFSDGGLTPQRRAHAVAQRQAHDAERKAEHHAQVERNRELLKLENLRNSLGGLLAHNPDDREILRLFHVAEDKLHSRESGLPHHEDGPIRSEPTPAIPGWIHEEMHQIGANFNGKETARSTRAA